MDGSGTVTEVIFYCFSDTHMSVYTIFKTKNIIKAHNLALASLKSSLVKNNN
jgi:hypothetical protein